LRMKEKLSTAVALYFLEKGQVGAHTQAGSPVRGSLNFCTLATLNAVHLGCKQTTNTNACLMASHSI